LRYQIVQVGGSNIDNKSMALCQLAVVDGRVGDVDAVGVTAVVGDQAGDVESEQPLQGEDPIALESFFHF
jgi:hypothetical protein